jgi:hypothetical protein
MLSTDDAAKVLGAIVPEVSVLGADPIEDNRNYFGFEA